MRRNQNQHKSSYYQQLLTAIFGFMIVAGIRPREIEQVVAAALRDSQPQASKVSTSRRPDLYLSARLVESWHRNRLYVDKRANPKAIPLKGRAPSIEALIKADKIDQDIDVLVKRLKAAGAIVRCGRNLYKPTTNVIVVPELDAYLQAHIAHTLAMLLRTVRRNVAVSKPTDGLIERRAEVMHLPVEYEPEFRHFAKAQAAAFLERVNDWLESRRARKVRKHQQTIRAGVHVFAYADDETELLRSPRRAVVSRMS